MIPSSSWSSAVGLALYLSLVPGTGAQALIPGPEPAADDGGETAIVASDSRYGPVDRRDNLWAIAEQHTQPPASVHQTVVAIYHLNPQAFLNGDIHRLTRDVYLELPSRQQVLSRSPRAAEAEYRRLSLGQVSPPRLATAAPETAEAQPQEEPAGNRRQDEAQSRLLDELREQLMLSNAQLTELNQFNRQLRQHVSALSDEVQELKVSRAAAPLSEPGWLETLADNKPYLLSGALTLSLLLMLVLLRKRRGRQPPETGRTAPTPADRPAQPPGGAAHDRLTIRLPPTAPTVPPEEQGAAVEEQAPPGLNLVDTPSRYVPALDDVPLKRREPASPSPGPLPAAPDLVPPVAGPLPAAPDSVPPVAGPMPAASGSVPPVAEPMADRAAASVPGDEPTPEPARSKVPPTGSADKVPEFRLEVGLDEYADVLGHQEVDVDQDEGGIGCKLDLARAYIEIGEQGSARALLKQAMKRGNAEQQQEAKKLLQRL